MSQSGPVQDTAAGPGGHCYLANNRDDTVSVVSYAARREVARIPVGAGPKYLVAARVPTDVLARAG